MTASTESVDLDAVFLRELLAALGHAAVELGIARGRLRKRGNTLAFAQVGEARRHVTRVRSDLKTLADRVCTGFALDEALDVKWAQQATWALMVAGEAVDTARQCLRGSARQWVARGHLSDAHSRLSAAHRGLTELSRRAWEA